MEIRLRPVAERLRASSATPPWGSGPGPRPARRWCRPGSRQARSPGLFSRAPPISSTRSPQRLERRAEVAHEELRLLPRREVAALVVPGVEDELGIGLLSPALRG